MASGRYTSHPYGGFDLWRKTVSPWEIISVAGEVDSLTSPRLKDALDEPIPAEGKGVAVDLTRMTFCDSSGLGVLIGAWMRLNARNQRLILLRAPEFFRKRLRTAGMADLIPIMDSVRSA